MVAAATLAMAKRTSSSLKCTEHRTVQHYNITARRQRRFGGGTDGNGTTINGIGAFTKAAPHKRLEN
jgi:hypothetical protein